MTSSIAKITLMTLAVSYAWVPPSNARADRCPYGDESSDRTSGPCCWPGQRYDAGEGECTGEPRCPAGTSRASRSGNAFCEPDDPIAWSRSHCEAGFAASCTNLGTWLLLTGSGDASYRRAAPYFRQGCEGRDAHGCLELHGALRSIEAPAEEREAALTRGMELTSDRCSEDRVDACVLRAGLLLERDDEPSHRRALEIAEQRCDGGHDGACNYLFEAMKMLGQIDAAIRRAAALCEASSGDFCWRTGNMIDFDTAGSWVPQEVYYYEKGCHGGHAFACAQLADTLKATKRHSERARIVASYRKACEGGFSSACQSAEASSAGMELTDEHSPPIAAAPVAAVDQFEPFSFDFEEVPPTGPSLAEEILAKEAPPGPEDEAACKRGDIERCEHVGTYWESPKDASYHLFRDGAPPAPEPDREKAERFARIGCDLGSLRMCSLEGNLRVQRYKAQESGNRP